VLVNRTLLLMAGMTKPPDPNTKVPRLKCPPGAIDAHLHLFGPKALYPIDANSVYETADALPETLIGMHRVLGLSGGVLVSGGAYGRNPRHLLDTLARFPHYFRGVAVPPDRLAPQEIDHMHRLGVRGVRFSTHPRARHLWASCSRPGPASPRFPNGRSTSSFRSRPAVRSISSRGS
jgi:2-pyrone-4,6-dicarboxylate lactonase